MSLYSYDLIDLEQGSQEWLNFRKTKIGASEAPIIMGRSPWCTPQQLLEQKLGLRDAFAFESEAMRWGKDNEPVARAQVEKLLGIDLSPVVCVSKDRPWMMASLDGLSLLGDTAVEIKCLRSSSPDYEVCMEGQVPEKYQIQLQHQMEVLKLDSMFFFTFTLEKNILVEVKRDNFLIEEMIEWEEDFLNRMREGRLFKNPPKIVEDKDLLFDAQRYEMLLMEVNQMTKEMADLKNKLVDACEGDDAVIGNLSIVKTTRKGSVDYSKIPELQNVDLKNYQSLPSVYYTVKQNGKRSAI